MASNLTTERSTLKTADQTVPFEQQPLYTLEHRGNAKFPKTEYETVSIAEICRRVESGLLRESTYVQGPGLEVGVTVALLISRAKGGALKEQPVANAESPEKDKRAVSLKDIESSMNRYHEAEAALARDRKIVADAKSELSNLQDAIDLADEKHLDKFQKLSAIATVAPARLQSRTTVSDRRKDELLKICNRVIRELLAPRFSTLESRTLQAAEERLKGHFRSPDELRAAAYRTTLMEELQTLESACRITSENREDSAEIAKRTIESSRALDDFEKKRLSGN